jgi:hypothetical protein
MPKILDRPIPEGISSSEELLTAGELAPKIKCKSVDTIYRLQRAGVIPCFRVNHKIMLFRLSEVYEALEKYYHVPAKPLPRHYHPKRKEVAK